MVFHRWALISWHFSKIYTRSVSFHFQMPTKEYTSILIFMINAKTNLKKSKKSLSISPSHYQWHSLERICNSLLMLHCKQMPWDWTCFMMYLCVSIILVHVNKNQIKDHWRGISTRNAHMVHIVNLRLYKTPTREKNLSFKRPESCPIYTRRCNLWF